MFTGVSLDAETPFSRFYVKSSNHCGRSRNNLPCTGSVSLLFHSDCWESRNWSPSTGLLVLRRRVIAGLDVESSDESCGNDVGEKLVVELEEPVDNPGTTIGTSFSVMQCIFCRF